MSVEAITKPAALAMPRKMQDECAVFGIYDTNLKGSDAARLAYFAMIAQQHRGQEAAGIATANGRELKAYKDEGLVVDVFKDPILEELEGFAAIGHDRYSTSKGARRSLAHPVYSEGHDRGLIHIPGVDLTLVHNGNLARPDKLASLLDELKIGYGDTNDSGMIGRAMGHFVQRGYPIEEAVAEVYPHLEGAFSAIALSKNTMVGFRDRNGTRPFVLGNLNGGPVLASESCAFDTIDASLVRDVRAGEMVVIKDNNVRSEQLVPADPKLCVSEFFYVARPDSVVEGQLVYSVRERMGMMLAEEEYTDADVVFDVPDTAAPIAFGYAAKSGIPYRQGLARNRYIGRTFIQPTQDKRDQGVFLKLNPVLDVVRGNRAIVVDDSLVRGTTLPKVVKMLRDAGAAEVHVKIATPPFRHPIVTGIDTADYYQLIAANMSHEEIRQHIKADSLQYLSLDGLVKAIGIPEQYLDTSFHTGVYSVSPGELVGAR